MTPGQLPSRVDVRTQWGRLMILAKINAGILILINETYLQYLTRL